MVHGELFSNGKTDVEFGRKCGQKSSGWMDQLMIKEIRTEGDKVQKIRT